MEEVELFEFAFGEGVVLAIGNPVVFLGFIHVLLPCPALFVEFSDTVACVREVAGFVEFKCAFLVLRIAQSAFAENIGKVALGQVIAQGNGTLVPVHGPLNVLLDAHAVLEEGADAIDKIRVIEGLMLIIVRNDVEHIFHLLARKAVVFGVAGVGEEELATVYRDFWLYLFLIHSMPLFRIL
jgi:hypothetical protein